VIDESLLTRAMFLAKHHIQMPRPGAVLLAEPGDMCCNTCFPLCGGRIYVAQSFESHD
jgi:hypothetical protein